MVAREYALSYPGHSDPDANAPRRLEQRLRETGNITRRPFSMQFVHKDIRAAAKESVTIAAVKRELWRN